jgi:tRNA G10  N-methylase Trm11
MKRYLISLGRKEKLALAELQSVIGRCKRKASEISITEIDQAAILESQKKLDVESLISILGGTVKIVLLGEKAESKNFIDKLTTILRNESIGKSKLIFGISLVNSKDPNQRVLLPKALKDRLASERIASRYVLATKSDELTTSQVVLSDVTEIYVVFIGQDIEIGKTVALQDFQGFANRDYQRPFADPKQGMLPPKVARMMVNLAFAKPISSSFWLLDPFCGTGTIAMEALMLGINTLSSDHSQEKVVGTKQNLDWLTREEQLKGKWRVFQSDATKVCLNLKDKVDAIVTEPYLGPAKLSRGKIHDLVKGLNKLYLGALKNWRKCLRPKARVVIVIPEFNIDNLVKRADLAIDTCENVGYTLVAGPFEYDRPQAIVKRQIYVLEKQ